MPSINISSTELQVKVLPLLNHVKKRCRYLSDEGKQVLLIEMINYLSPQFEALKKLHEIPNDPTNQLILPPDA